MYSPESGGFDAWRARKTKRDAEIHSKGRRSLLSSNDMHRLVREIDKRLGGGQYRKYGEGIVACGDALALIPTLPDRSVDLCLTSPPYAMQRQRQYGGVSEDDYPEWTCKWMAALRPKLTSNGSVLLVIRSHVRDGVVSDYVLRTRLALRAKGWYECEELIWLKTDAPPLGSTKRPRRTWEQILWFSRTPQPFINLKANGGFSQRIGFVGSHRFRNGESPINTKRPSVLRNGPVRTPDVFTAHVAEIEKGIRHTALYPASLCEQLIRIFSRKGDLVLDPFAGSGTTLLAARNLGRNFIGLDSNRKYVKIATARLRVRSDVSSVPTGTSGVGLRPDFPQNTAQQRAYLLSKGLNKSDVQVFSLVLDQTVNSTEHVAYIPLSLSDIADLTGFSRRTVIRSVERLRDAGMIVTRRDSILHHHDGSLIGLAPKFLVPIRNGDTRGRVVTNAAE